MPRILHTSDVQLDAPFHFLGAKGHQHRQQLRKTFQRIVDMAAEDAYDLLLIAGDLFNDNRVRQDTVDFVALQLARLQIPVCILPGNHDCYDNASVYRKAQFPDNVLVFTEQPTVWESAQLDLVVYGSAIQSKGEHIKPLRGLTKTGDARWHIALAHGNMVRPDIIDPPRPIHPEEIGTSGMDYIAMGDWHAFADYSQGRVKAFYSGAPEPTSVSQIGAGYVASIEMDDNGVQVHPRQMGAIRTKEMAVDLSGRSLLEVVHELQTQADPNLILRVTFSGLTDLGTVLDVEKVEQQLSPYFYHVECSDQSHAQLASISSSDFSEKLVVGKFVRLMQSRIQSAATDEQRRRAEQALRVGVALLQGRRVL